MPSKVLSVSPVNLIVDRAGSDNGFSVIFAYIRSFLVGTEFDVLNLIGYVLMGVGVAG